MRWFDGITDAMEVNLGKLREMLRDRRPGMMQTVEYNLVSEQQILSNLCS